MSFVVKKVETNVFSLKVNSERGRVAHGSVICDYAVWLGSFFCHMYTLQSGQMAPGRETFKEESRLHSCRCDFFFFFLGRIIDKPSVNPEHLDL